MTTQIRLQAFEAKRREAQAKALHALSQELSGQPRVFEILRTAAQLGEQTFGGTISIFRPDAQGKLSFARRTSDRLPVPSSEEGIAQWVLEHGQKAGRGTQTLPGATALYVPLKGATAGGMFMIISVKFHSPSTGCRPSKSMWNKIKDCLS